MNKKRQTVWLVSMLSIMVMLSAYYLFTEDVNKMNQAAGDLGADEIVVQTLEQQSGGEAAMEEEMTEEEILRQVEAQAASGQALFTEMKLEREEKLNREANALMETYTDGEKPTETVVEARQDLYELQDMQQKITHLEEVLMQTYENVFVSQENNEWKVVVKAPKLEKSEAVSIVDMVMKEMNVGPGQVTVEYRS